MEWSDSHCIWCGQALNLQTLNAELVEALENVTNWVAYPQTTVRAESFAPIFKLLAKAKAGEHPR